MFKHRNTDVNGKAFSPAVIQEVWDKAETSAHPPLKLDALGTLIWREAFGNNNSKLGWEIHHRVPVEHGGSDDLENLEAVQWENHRRLDIAAAKLPETVIPNVTGSNGDSLSAPEDATQSTLQAGVLQPAVQGD